MASHITAPLINVGCWSRHRPIWPPLHAGEQRGGVLQHWSIVWLWLWPDADEQRRSLVL